LRAVRVHVVDPSAFTPPYDHALSAALVRAGADVELVTSRFLYGPAPAPAGYRVDERFYGASGRPRVRARSWTRMAVKLAEHVPEMLAYRSAARRADIVHFQWLTVQPVDWAVLPAGPPSGPPRVLTAHDVIPREPRPGQIAATRRLLHRMDAVVVHSEHGAGRLRDELGLPAERIRVIPHGAFDHYARIEGRPLPDEFARVEGPVILCFGLLRPYKGIDVLLEAFREVEGAELWIVGMPRMPIEPLRELAARVPGTVRFVPRFVGDDELPAYFRRADVVVLPYREIDQSGVLYTALAFGKPLVLSRVGGFTEVGERHGAARLVPPGDATALAGALDDLVRDPAERERLRAAAARAAATEYSWDAVAGRTMDLYRELLSRD
jgi:glycosyltransferase involved in cell wall biosynthesis